MSTDPLRGLRVAFLTANEGVEEVELTSPWRALEDSGGIPSLVAPEHGEVQMFNHLDRADRWVVDLTTQEADPNDFDAVVLPGGVVNPDQLRLDRRAVAFVVNAFATGKPVGAICHGPWTLVEADVVRGRVLTSWPSLCTDITNAGGSWIYEAVVVCTSGPNTLVTSRMPEDLEVFCSTLVDELASTNPLART